MHRTAGRLIATIALMSCGVPALAQNAEVTALTDKIKADTELEKAKAERAKAEAERIKALGLPSFEGKTTLGDKAGAMETTLLTSSAVGSLAQQIATDKTIAAQKRVLVLTRDEILDESQAAAVELEVRAILQLYRKAKVATSSSMLSAGIAAISALGGLIRSDATLSYVDASAVDDRMLAWAVASKLGAGKAVLPSAMVGAPIGPKGTILLTSVDELSSRRILAEEKRRALAAKEKLTAEEKLEVAALEAATTRHDAFFTKVTTPNDKGVVPLLAAARIADLFADGTPILRIRVDQAGGSLVNTKNLFTTLGVDPLKVSGGVLASYVLTSPASGAVLKADVISCRTTLTSIRKVQESRWQQTSAPCQSVLGNGN